MKRNQQKDATVPKIKFHEFRDAWITNSREFARSRPMILKDALLAAGVREPRRPRSNRRRARG